MKGILVAIGMILVGILCVSVWGQTGGGGDAEPRLPPVGSVVAWLKSASGTPQLPGAWVECNGQMIGVAGSPYNGRAAPNLNGADGEMKRFLRGATTSGEAGGTETHDHGKYRSQKYGSQRLPAMNVYDAKHIPPYYEVVWIMRVK